MAAPSLDDASDDDSGAGAGSLFAEINITPLTDVFLVMVVIFMVSALAVQAEREHEKRIETKKPPAIAVQPPPGSTSDINMHLPTLVVEVTVAGDVYIGGKHFTDAELPPLFERAHQRDKQTQLIVRADRGVVHGRVVQIMELARRAGFPHVAIGTSHGATGGASQ